jgi:DNA-binding NarL/FixJ family response regulator
MIKVMVVDDDIDAARALKRNIDGQDGISVIEILDNGVEAVDRCQELKPDIILMDAKMPVLSGIDACRKIKQANSDVKVLILTFYQVKENEINAVRYGCDGYIYKGHKSEDLIAIIKSTYGGFTTFENGVRKTINDQMAATVSNEVYKKELNELSEREVEIVRLITAGKKDTEIARELFVSEGYIRNQLVVIREKLGLRNSKELAVWGAKAGL